MADNQTKRGFRWFRSESGSGDMPTYILPVATGFATMLARGDAVKFAADGSVARAAAGDALIAAVVCGVKQYWNGTVRTRGTFLPASTVYGTDLSKQSLLEVVPVIGQIFEVDGNSAAIATTEAAYQALVNENCDHVVESVGTLNISGMALDLSTHAITSAQWRIVGVSPQVNHDFTGNRVKLLVQCNESETVPYSKTVSA